MAAGGGGRGGAGGAFGAGTDGGAKHGGERPRRYEDVEACVDDALARVGRRVVLGTPLGLGKANDLVNAFYRRAAADPGLDLTIVTALTLERPTASSDLERRLVEPLAERLFGDYPPLDYARDRDRGALPANVRVREFYYSPGSQLGHRAAQQDHIASNYSFVVRDLLDLGINVVAQAVAEETVDGRSMLSLSCNTDLTLDLMPELARIEALDPAAGGRPIALLAQVNRNLPFLYGDAMVAPEGFHGIVDHPRYRWHLPSVPNLPISTADHAIGIHASALVRDGGTLQLGIGSLGDAIAHALELRHDDNACWRAVLGDLGVTASWGGLVDRLGGTGTFERGLYGATEMLVDGFLDLYRAGILKRRVYPDAAVQRLLDAGRLGEEVGAETLEVLVEAGAVGEWLSEEDAERLRRLGVLLPEVAWERDGEGRPFLRLPDAGERLPAHLADPEVRRRLAEAGLGERLRGGRLTHSGFFLGPGTFYEELRRLPREERELFEMTAISFVNELYGPDQELKRAQRRHARFVNSGLKVTLLGAVASETLESGQVLSGVGGQYNFVAMAHALDEGRSILMVRAVRESGGAVESNVVWSQANATIPRHLRDLVLTEYGIADLRGRSDAECIDALLRIADSRFQEGLQEQAKRAGKLAADHHIPERHRHNTPERLETAFAPYRERGLFAELPFGSEVTEEERVLVKALKALQGAARHDRWSLLDPGLLRQVLTPPPATARPYLERMDLAEPANLRERALQKAVLGGLALVGAI